MNWANVWEVVKWVAGGTGAGTLAYWVMNRIPWQPAQAELKRYSALALSVVLAWAAYFILAWAGLTILPVGGPAWVEQLFAIAVPAILASQSIHASRELRQADKAAKAEIAAAASDCSGACCQR